MNADARRLNAPHPRTPIEGQALALLLVEDDDGDALLVRDELDAVGGDVRLTRARSLAEALPLLGAAVDCVLLDLGLPDASGLDALARIQARAPHLAVVVLTGLDDPDAGAAALRAGAQDYLVKGRVHGDVLLRAVRYAVGRLQAETARRELEIAAVQARESARLERGLLPTPILDGAPVRVGLCSRPGRRRTLLGGDFYDVVETADGVHVLIGDVCGHGPDEAALGVSLRSAWRALVLSGAPAETVLSTLDAIVERERHLPGLFATLCTLHLNPDRRRLRMHRAGHVVPHLLGDDGVTPLPDRPAGPPIGVSGGAWPHAEVALPDRWAVLLHTDGLTDVRMADGEVLGEERLRAILAARLAAARAQGAPLDLAAVIESVEEMHGGPLRDDVALVLVESLGAVPGSGR